jgi:hypothetical protein
MLELLASFQPILVWYKASIDFSYVGETVDNKRADEDRARYLIVFNR